MQDQGVVGKLFLIVFAVVAGSWIGHAQASSTPDRAATATTQSGGASSASGSAPTAQRASQASTDEAPTDNGGKKNTHVRLGTVTVSAGYVHAPNSYFFYPFFPGSFGYAPSFYDPFYWPSYAFYGSSLAYAADKGKVELAVDRKNAEVYIDDAYAGQASRLKSIWLAPGAYNLAVTNAEGLVFQQRIYVLSGKSVKVKAKLAQQTTQARPEEKQP